MKAGRIANAASLIVLGTLACLAAPECQAHGQSPMKASFNLEFDKASDTVSLRPSVQADTSATLDYKIRISKRGKAGTSMQSNGGRIDVKAGKDVVIGPLLRFGSFAEGDSLHAELLLCRKGSRCHQSSDVIASFSTSYPDEHGASN